MAEDKYRCEICPKLCTIDEISFMEDNEFDLDLCDSCLEGQREIDAQEERKVDLDFVRDVRREIGELQELERRGIENRLD